MSDYLSDMAEKHNDPTIRALGNLANEINKQDKKIERLTDELARLRSENDVLLTWARRAYVMLDCVEAEGNWNMFNLLEDAPSQVQEVSNG